MSRDIYANYIQGKKHKKIKKVIQAANIGTSVDQVDIAIVNGNVVLPEHGVIKTNLYIHNGKVYSLGNNFIKSRETINAANQYVIPGVIDPHVHLGLFETLETEIETETKAALLGGITTIGCYFGGSNSHFFTFPTIVEQISKLSFVDVIPHLVISTNEQKKEIVDYVNGFGVTSFKVYMSGIPGLIPDVDDGFILDVFDEIKKSNKKCIVCSHSENPHIVRNAHNKVMQDKGEKANIIDWTDTHPDIAEEEAVTRISYLAEKSGIPVYLVHISSAPAIKRLRNIKPFNKYIYIETTSPYLSLTKHSSKDNSIKMVPPFRDMKDLEELWIAVEEGLVDTIGTDNVTMTKDSKKVDQSIWEVIPGYPALETHLPILLHEGIIKRGIPIEKLISRITKRPAEIFNVYPQKGTILPGSDADVVIIDLNLSKKITADDQVTRSDFSIYHNKEVQGLPVTTIKAGEIVVRDGKYLENKPQSKCIYR